MGIRGLSSFIECNPHLLAQEKLHDTRVVVDGNNLFHYIYYSGNYSVRYGGEYDKFYDSAVKFFGSLQQCAITPCIVFDGSSETDDRKLRTTLERAKNRIKLAKAVANGQKRKVLPILTYDVFKCVLDKLHIAHVQCDFEADDQIVALANHWRCPVLSQDSDFYIFEIAGGFIPLHFLDTEVQNYQANSKPKYCLEACVYYVSNFAKHFGGISINLLPIFGTLMGNDYVDTERFSGFYARIKMPKVKSKSLVIGKRYSRMAGLLVWLQNFEDATTDAIIDCVLHYVKKDERSSLRELIQTSLNAYSVSESTLVEHFETDHKMLSDSKIQTYHLKTLPSWLATRCRNCEVPTFVLNALVLHRIINLCQVENSTFPSAYTVSKRIRQVIYGILLRDEVTEDCIERIKEFDRLGSSLQSTNIDPILKLPDFSISLSLHEASALTQEESLNLLCATLMIKETLLHKFSRTAQLAVASLIYWVRNAKPRVTLCHVVALLVSFLKGLVIDRSITERSGTLEDDDNNKSTFDDDNKSTFNGPSIFVLVSSCEAKLAKEVLQKFSPLPKHNHATQFDVNIVHAFSQWQSCMKDAVCLNRLLQSPLPNTNPALLYNGCFVYNLCHNLLGRKNVPLYVLELLGRTSQLAAQFNVLYSLAVSLCSSETLAEPEFKEKTNKQGKEWEEVDFVGGSVNKEFVKKSGKEVVDTIKANGNSKPADEDLVFNCTISNRYLCISDDVTNGAKVNTGEDFIADESKCS